MTKKPLLNEAAPRGLWKNSIRVRLILSFTLLFILGMAAIELSSLYGIPLTSIEGRKDARMREAYSKLELLADIKENQLLSWVQERRADVHLLAGNELSRQRLENLQLDYLSHLSPSTDFNWKAFQNSEAYRAAALYYGNILETYPDSYLSIQVVSTKDGHVLYSTHPEEVGRDMRHHSAYQGALRSEDDFFGDMAFAADSSATVLAIAHVVRNLRGELLGVLIFNLNAEQLLRPMLHTGAGLGKNGEALLVNRDARILTSLKHRLADGTAAAPLQYRISAEPAARAARGEKGAVESRDYRGTMVLAAYRYLPITENVGWGLVVKMDRDEILVPLNKDITFTLILVMIGGLLVGVATVFLGRSLTRPLLLLGQSADRFASGDMSVRCNLDRRDEIGRLGQTLDHMADTIENTVKGLERHAHQLQETTTSLETQKQIQQQALSISTALSSASDLQDLLLRILAELRQVTRSQAGAIYLSEGSNADHFTLACHSGLARGCTLPEYGKGREAPLSLTHNTPGIEVLQDLPETSRYIIKTIAGEAIPKTLVNITLKQQEHIIGLLTMASLYPILPEQVEVLEMVRPQMATAILNLQNHAATEMLAGDLQNRNEELAAMNEELQSQSEELQSQSEELQSQSEQLQQQTRELKQRTTQLEEQRSQVEEADRLKSEFLSNMSHELRTPLNSVLALSQLMIAQGTGVAPEKELEHLQVIERNGRHLLELINDILDLSKIESGRMEVCPSEFFPSEVLNETIATIRPLCNEKGLSLNVHAEQTPAMESDADKLRQILINLLSNAAKFTSQGEIQATLSCQDNGIIFTIADTGMGIPEAALPHIFERFRQGDGSTTRRHEGTGLGLAICENLTRMLGGTIAVTSTEGHGSTFTVTIPLQYRSIDTPTDIQPSTHTAPSVPETSTEKNTGDSVTREEETKSQHSSDAPLFIVVEDNPVATLQIRTVLEEQGYSVTCAASGNAALKALEHIQPDGIILDLMLPQVDGFQFLEALKADTKNVSVPVLVLTAKDLSKRERARLSGGNVRQVVAKGSLDRSQLLEAIKNLLSPLPFKAQLPVAPLPPSNVRPILIVEDHADNRLTLQAHLDAMGRKSIIAEDGDEAIHLAKTQNPSLILMDINLPKVNGIEATHRIKTDPQTSHIPIVALTALAMKGDREKLLAAGCDDYLAKPLDPEKLYSLIDQCLNDRTFVHPV